jgi:hypothetical protein
MVQYINATLEALQSGDISYLDACYSLSAHLMSPSRSDETAQQETQTEIEAIVFSVFTGKTTAEKAARDLRRLKRDPHNSEVQK